MSDFYFRHGMSPSYSHQMGNIRTAGQREEGWHEANEQSSDGFDNNNCRQETTESRFRENLINGVEYIGSRKRPRNYVLNESSLDELAVRYGYTKIKIALTTAPLASYRRGVCRLNFWLTTGNVGSYLDHPTKGKTLLVRRDINLNEAESVFQNPMHQIGREYRRTTN